MKKHIKMTFARKLQLLAGAATVALLAGCASSGYKHADKTGEGIAEFRDEVVKAKQAVDGAMAGLGKIIETAASDPRKAYEAFAKGVERVESARAKAGKRAADMKAAGQAYFKQWEKQMEGINNPEIRELAEKRKAKLTETFGKIAPLLQNAKADFDPFMSDLVDLRTFLSNDLTVNGVDAAKDIFKKTRDHGAKLQGSLDDLVAEMNSISATLTPAKK
jgi:hypothetical protein